MKNKCQNFWLLILATCVSCQQVASFGYSVWRLASCEFKLRVHTERFRGSLATWLVTRQSRNAQNQLFKELFRGKLVLNLFPSSLKPLFQYFYIKTQPIWIFFHSINISKVILNSFHWFGSLDYVLVSFVLLVGIFIVGVGKT